MYQEIINDIKSNLGENKDLNKRYLSSQIDKYKDHPYNKDIIREISRMLWDCLTQEEQKEYGEISKKENPVMDILDEISYDIELGDLKTALDKIDSFMQNFYPMFEDDKVSEYHYFTNPLEENIFNNYIKAEKIMRYIPDDQPYLDLYYIYGFLLLENNQLEKAETYLKKALKINPVSSRVILELTEIYKIKTPSFNKFYLYTTEALKYAYYPQDIGRCYRNLGYYYIEENKLKEAAALFIYSMEYYLSPIAYSELQYIKSKGQNIDLSIEESVEIIKNKNLQIGPNPFVLETINRLIEEFDNDYSPNRLLYFYKILYGLTHDELTLTKIESLENKINY